jgi:hypothetical protein
MVVNASSIGRDWFGRMVDGGSVDRDLARMLHYPAYTENVSVVFYRELFDRMAIARRVVRAWPLETWQVQPRMCEVGKKDGQKSDFVDAWNGLDSAFSNGGQSWHKSEKVRPLYQHCFRADMCAGIGRLGVTLLGIDDGLNLQEPVDGTVVMNSMFADAPLLPDDHRYLNEQLLKVNAKPYRPSRYELAVRDGGLKVNGKSFVPPVMNYTDESMLGSTAELTTREAQYATQYGALGAERQYFGVSFGPSEQMGKPSKKKHRLLFMRVYDETLVQIVRYEWNILNPRFGLPVMYRITLNDPRYQSSGIGLPLATVYVHWSRVIHIADNLVNSELFGAPRLQAVLDNILALQKLYGSSAEGYFKSCFARLSLESNPTLGGDIDIDTASLEEMMDEFEGEQRGWLALAGLSAKTLAPNVVDLTPHVDKQIEAICIEIDMPKRVFMGAERGEQASTQDDSKVNDNTRGRQLNFATCGILVPLADRLIQVGVLPEPGEGYYFEWPSIDSQSAKDKATVCAQLTAAAAQWVQSGLSEQIPAEFYFEHYQNLSPELVDKMTSMAVEQSSEEDGDDDSSATQTE